MDDSTLENKYVQGGLTPVGAGVGVGGVRGLLGESLSLSVTSKAWPKVTV